MKRSRTSMEQAFAQEMLALAEIAIEARTTLEFRIASLELLQRVAGFDSAVFTFPGRAMATLNKAPSMRSTYLASRNRYAQELATLTYAASRLGGAAVDHEIMPVQDLDRLGFYQEIVRPQGISSVLVGPLCLRGRPAARLFLARHGRRAVRFGVQERERITRLLPVLALGDGLERRSRVLRAPHGARADVSDVDWTLLTPRELELLDYVARGWRNPEIALAMGTSRFTVRNQLAGVFRKCGATTRAELIRLAFDGGLLAPSDDPEVS